MTKRASGSQLRKKDVPSAIKQLHLWVKQNRKRIDALPDKDMVRYLDQTIDDIERRINEQDYAWAIQSLVRHLISTLQRMEDGDIVSMWGETGFNLRPMRT